MFILSNMGKDHEFLEAARNGNVILVEKILNQKAKRTGPLASLRRGPGANVRDSSGYSALHHATLNGHTDIVRLLLAHDASPDLPDSRGSSPLHLAAWAGHQDIVKLFLTHPHRPANPNLQTIENETPLHCAAQHGHTGALTTLLAHGANPNVMNIRHETPLDLAAQYGRLQVVQMLIRAHPELLLPFKAENGIDSTILSHSPLHLASRNGHKNVVEVLLAAGINVNLKTPSGTALHEAALCGKDGVVRTLLDAGADLDVTDCEGRTALDILEEFPPHVTRGIVSVINNHRNSMTYDSESDEVRDTHKTYTIPMSLGSSYENNRGSPVQNYFNSHHDITTSPSSSIGSLGPSSPSPRPRASTGDLPEFYITMAPVKTGGKFVPKKPPRRNLSVSPTHLQPHINMMSMSADNYGDSKSNRPGTYEYICLARTGPRSDEKMNRIHSMDQYVEMRGPTAAPRNIIIATYENTTLKSYNPNRKLKRNRDNYEPFSIDFNKDRNNIDPNCRISGVNTSTSIRGLSDKMPQSPTNYKQPPTPEHPPPSASQAEKFIHERIRPLSQEYKRRSGLQPNLMMESGTSPPEPLCSSLCASSGSISSSVSISDRSVSTDCVEEFIGDVPFAGLFKGSTMTLNNANLNYSQFQPNQSQYFHANENVDKHQERPKTLHSYHHQDAVNTLHRRDYQKNRSRSFGGTLDDDFISTGANDYNGSGNCDKSSFQNKMHVDLQVYISKTTREGGQIDDKAMISRKGSKQRTSSEELLSPFNEEEAWAKISEIMESFGSGILCDETRFHRNGQSIKNGATEEENPPRSKLSIFLNENILGHIEEVLIENGFDNVEFLNGVLDDCDLVTMNISIPDRTKLMDAIKNLPVAQSLPVLHNSNNNSILNVDQWLNSIQLSDYSEIFKKHLYTTMEGVCRVWEVELQTVLEINKVGHRKRILHSVSANRHNPPTSTIEALNADLKTLKANIMELRGDFIDKAPNEKNSTKTSSNESIGRINRGQQKSSSNGMAVGARQGNKKNRPAPKPPTRAPSLEIRAPSELLLGLPSNLRTQWRHSASSLVNGSVKYDVYYLGSTVVKELRGTESTRKSIQKLKRDDRVMLQSSTIGLPQHQHSQIVQQQQIHPQLKKQPVRLSISHRGVEFINVESKNTICEHEIRNINCACQDADDLSHFAYITKDADMNTHYCHVFNVDSMDLATEIILTLGQAFEVAYQLALREISPKTPSCSSVLSGYK